MQMNAAEIMPAAIAVYPASAVYRLQTSTALKRQGKTQPGHTMDKQENDPKINRRKFLATGARASVLVGIGGVVALVAKKTIAGQTVWQLDPAKCIQCGRCATNCVLTPSAVKCVHVYAMCGYCDLCGGYFKPETKTLTTGAENQLCPTNAIKRKFIEDPFFEYTIDEPLCIGCGKCVKGCGAFGNGSLQLQIRHNICVNCNECSIARNCPADAFSRVPASQPYLFKGFGQEEENTKK
jgi:electron transport complex protein RnfB